MGQDPQAEILTILKDLQKKMGYLEKKVDSLSEKLDQKSSYKSTQRPTHKPTHRPSRPGSYSPGAKPQAEGSFRRYKDKHESAFGTKTPGGSTWYEKKKGADVRSGSKAKKSSKPVKKKRST